MSKMTVVDESTQSHKYESLEFSEFIEFMARMAYQAFPGESTCLSGKNELLMDVLFPTILNCKRVVVQDMEEQESESDCDY